MEFIDPHAQFKSVLSIDRIERWNIYSRLQQLAISCRCQHGQPLQVDVETAGVAIQLWSVIQQFTAPRSIRIDRLERCWEIECRCS